MVQKGKFSASIFCEVRALNNVDLPTFGRPTIPHLILILSEGHSWLSASPYPITDPMNLMFF